MATIFSGLAITFGYFLILRALVGIGEGTFYGASFGLSSQTIPEKYLTLGLAVINVGQAVGQILGTTLASMLVLQYHHAWGEPFVIVGIPTVLVGCWYLITRFKTATPRDATAIFGKIDRQTLFQPRLVGVYVMLFASIYGQITLLTWLPLFLTNQRHLTGQAVSLLTMIVPLLALPSALIFARLNDRYRQTQRLLGSLVCIAALSLVGIVLVKDARWLMVTLIIYGVTGKMAIDPLLLYTVKKYANQQQLATTFGVYNFFGMLGSILAPVITGWFMDMTGDMWPGFLVAALLLMVGLGCLTIGILNEQRQS